MFHSAQEQSDEEKALSHEATDQKLELQARTIQLQSENEACHVAIRQLAKDKVELQTQEKLLQAEIQELHRCTANIRQQRSPPP